MTIPAIGPDSLINGVGLTEVKEDKTRREGYVHWTCNIYASNFDRKTFVLQ